MLLLVKIHDITGTHRAGFTRGAAPFNLRNLKESAVPGSELFPCSCALVEVILDFREDLRPLFFNIVRHISMPNIWDYIQSNIPFCDPLPQYLKRAICAREFGNYPRKYINNKRTTEPWYYEMQELGVNYRITDFQCALGVHQLSKLERFMNMRRRIANQYTRCLGNIPKIILPVERNSVRSAWHLYCIRCQDSYRRKRTFAALRKNGIGVQVHYLPVYWHPYYQRLGYGKGICPMAEGAYERLISLPMFPAMTDTDVDDVIEAVGKVIDAYRE